MSTFTLSDDEHQLMAKHRLAVFAGRIIFNTLPPITDAQRQKIESVCDGPLPQDILDLWDTSFGGDLDYDLTAQFGDLQQSLSFGQLFYPGSDHYHDLDGWIEHELEMIEEVASERGQPFSGKTPVLPFGGFEYLERAYIVTKATQTYAVGDILYWMKGLPPAWEGRLHQDSVITLAKSMTGLFTQLHFKHDPFDETGE